MGAVQQMLVGTNSAASVTYATWNPSDIDSGLTLSGGNLVASVNTGTNTGVRATLGKSTGKWYWEIKITTSDNNGYIGVGTLAGARSDQTGSPHGSGQTWNGVIYTEGAFQGQISAFFNTTNTIIGLALDVDAGTLAYRINNSLQTTQTIATSQTYYPQFVSSGTTQVITANFGATSLTYSPPAGFNAGLYV